jgi:succinate-semialdehyde dehydrogenase/glutarate-semialdehyde dehydrogenase
LIDGAWVSAGGRSLSVVDPATGMRIADVPDLGATDAEFAVLSAHKALPGWAGSAASTRASTLHRYAALVRQHQEDLARIITAEQGKPLAEARSEILYAAAYLQWFAEEARRVYGETIPAPQTDRRLAVMRQPVGVVAAVTPWNFPAAMLTRKVAPALAAGCTVVLKPSELAPLSALALARLGQEAGLPDGVLNVITGDPVAIGSVLTTHDAVRKLTFTGSTAVGKRLIAQCASTVKRVSMELGGNAPFIVFGSADIDRAIDGVMISKFRNAGQTCVCANRILVQSDIYDSFAERLATRVASLKVGCGFDEGVDVGPLINAAAIERVSALVADATANGGRCVVGGGGHPAGALFFQPTVLREATDRMRVFREEIFAPVAPLYRFDAEEHALAMANDTRSGLAAYVYTSTLNQYFRVVEKLQYGMVGVNTGFISTEVAPFGGIKESGMGREGSRLGMEDYLDTKTVCTGGLE